MLLEKMLSIKSLSRTFFLSLSLFHLVCSPNDKADHKTFVIATYDDVKDWDPATAFSLELLPMSNMYETLLWYDSKLINLYQDSLLHIQHQKMV